MTGVRRLHPGDDDWPPRLEHLLQPPAALWLCGTPPGKTSVAVVGSRLATPVGLRIARDLGSQLAELGVEVVSGMALGVDGAAHTGALDGGGFTTAVLGCGVDVCYPRRHRELRDRITASGGILSEEPLGAEPKPWLFPKRNRIIAALAVAVVVVEATEQSGALSTARWAADLGRDVFAVPGSIRSPQSRGSNLLIKDGARPLLGVQDLLDAVPELGGHGQAPGAPELPSIAGLAPALTEILERMGSTPLHPDELRAALGLPAPVVAARLGELEVAGAVLSLPGGLVARTF